MIFYNCIIIVISAFAFALYYKGSTKIKNIIFTSITGVALTVISAIRYDVGYDYSYIYSPIYQKVMSNNIFNLTKYNWEKTFIILCKSISYFSNNYHTLFIVTSILIVALYMIFYYKYSANIYISVFMFLCFGLYYCSLDFVRQSLAAAVFMFSFEFIKKRQFTKYMIITLLAMSIHFSAILMIPMYFISYIRINKFTAPIYIICLATVYNYSLEILKLVTKFFYSNYDPLKSKYMTASFEPMFMVPSIIIFIIAFIIQKKLTEIDKGNYILVNYAFFNMFFMVLGSKHSILDRLTLYFEPTVMLIIPIALQLIKQNKLSFSNCSVFKKLGLSVNIKVPTNYLHNAALTIVIVFGLLFNQYILYKDYHGVVPYKIIYNQPFYAEYVNSLKK